MKSGFGDGGTYLGGLRLDFTGTSERSVDFTHDCGLWMSSCCWFLELGGDCWRVS